MHHSDADGSCDASNDRCAITVSVRGHMERRMHIVRTTCDDADIVLDRGHATETTFVARVASPCYVRGYARATCTSTCVRVCYVCERMNTHSTAVEMS